MTLDTGFYLFASVKGGVGKSSLAVVTAKWLASAGRRPLLVDADLTGTSLSDGLKLVAPKLPVDAEGTLSLVAPAEGFLSYEETRAARRRRDAAGHTDLPIGIPFLNDALGFYGDDNDCRVDAMFWRHEVDDGVKYLPSSALRCDIEGALTWLNDPKPFAWVRRLAWVLEAALRYCPDITDVILDLPPGVWGFTHEALVLASNMAQGPLVEGYPAWPERQWNIRPFLVCSADSNDVLVALDYVGRHSVELPGLVPILNRPAIAIDRVREAVALEIAAATPFGALGLEQKLVKADFIPSLARIFIDRDVSVGPEVESLGRTLAMPAAFKGDDQ